MRRIRILAAAPALSLLAVACAGSGGGSISPGPDARFSAQMASVDLWAGDPQRIEIGLFASDADGIHVVTQGSVDVAFAYLGADGGGSPHDGPSATATYVPVPGTDASGSAPTLSAGTRGVYEADDVIFDRPGVWRVTVHAEIDGRVRQLNTQFAVADEPSIPAPGERAPPTQNLTIDSKGVDPASIDSMAVGGGRIPDRELHRWTIADAIRQGRPALVLFGTPAFCESRFCGPEVVGLQRLAAHHPDKAVFIHVEIWKDYDAQVVNRAAADWLLLPSGDLVEPWLFLIGADGRIAERWGPLFDQNQVAAALDALPAMSS